MARYSVEDTQEVTDLKRCILIVLVVFIVSMLPILSLAADTEITADNFEGYTINEMWTGSTASSAKWSVRRNNSAANSKVINENNGNSQGSANKVLEIGVDFSSSSPSETNQFTETKPISFTAHEVVTIKTLLRAPAGITANTDRVDIIGVNLSDATGTVQTIAPVLIRFADGTIRFNDGTATSGSSRGSYTAGRWYDITMIFTKGSTNTLKLTCVDTVEPSVKIEGEINIMGYDIHKTTAGTIRVNNQPNSAVSGTAWRTTAIDDFIITGGDNTAPPPLPVSDSFFQDFESFAENSVFLAGNGFTMSATGANGSNDIVKIGDTKVVKIGINNEGAPTVHSLTRSPVDFTKGVVQISCDYYPPEKSLQRFDIQIGNIKRAAGYTTGDNWTNIITNFNASGGIRFSTGEVADMVLSTFEPNRLYKVIMTVNPGANAIILDIIDTVDGTKSKSVTKNMSAHLDLSISNDANLAFSTRKNANLTGWGYAHIDNVKIESVESLKLISSTPADNSSDVNTDEKMKLTFNNPLNSLTVIKEKFLLNGKNNDVKSVSVTGKNEVEISFVTPLDEATSYTLSVADLEDIFGQKMTASSISFKTKTSNNIKIKSIKFYKNYKVSGQVDITELGLVNGDVTAVVTVDNTALTEEKISILLGYYEDEDMLDIKGKSYNIPPNSTNNEITVSMNVPSASLGINYINLHLWKNYKDILPYEKSISLIP